MMKQAGDGSLSSELDELQEAMQEVINRIESLKMKLSKVEDDDPTRLHSSAFVRDIMAMGSSRPVSSLRMEAPLSSDTSQEKLATPLLLRPEAGQVVQLVLSYRTSKRRNPTNYDVLRPLGDLATFTQSLVEQNISVMHFVGEALKIEAAEKAAKKAAKKAVEKAKAVGRTPEQEEDEVLQRVRLARLSKAFLNPHVSI